MDWNNDGKHDYHDDAFYFYVVSENAKQKCESSNNSSKSGASPNGKSALWVFILFIVWFIIKLIGG